MFVTAELLDKLKACKSQRNRFTKLFPSGVELTRELIVQHAQDFEWHWCAKNLASADGSAAYQRAEGQAYAAYWQAIEQALAAYDQAFDQAWAAYQQAVESAGATRKQVGKAAYRQAVDKAQDAYQRAVESAGATRKQAEKSAAVTDNLARATAFADIMGL